MLANAPWTSSAAQEMNWTVRRVKTMAAADDERGSQKTVLWFATPVGERSQAKVRKRKGGGARGYINDSGGRWEGGSVGGCTK